ncbi:hypothetical protein GCM10008939_37300 [Deinococcus aquiradiocola]|uniref:Uncharacterized protein n=1 Tax=Deinococcus aquiradiocola TaxID=393059 RepID=A0A917UWA2_9DEIO|nr:hypothetical protein GCM10008939_37300 [Deinococcus aquiradiocola]
MYTGAYKTGSPALLADKLTQGPRRLQSRLVLLRAGAYTMVLKGCPKPGFQCQPFTFSWPVRVDAP